MSHGLRHSHGINFERKDDIFVRGKSRKVSLAISIIPSWLFCGVACVVVSLFYAFCFVRYHARDVMTDRGVPAFSCGERANHATLLESDAGKTGFGAAGAAEVARAEKSSELPAGTPPLTAKVLELCRAGRGRGRTGQVTLRPGSCHRCQ